MKESLTSQQYKDLVLLLEDTVSHFCHEEVVSGEVAWKVVADLGYVKGKQFGGNRL